MNRKNLFICNTPYQVLMACNLANTLLRDRIVDIIISDHFNGGSRIVDCINEKHFFFRRAFYVQSLEFSRHRGKYQNLQTNDGRRLLYNINIRNILESFLQLNDKYDVLWLANYEEFSELLFNYIRQFVNKNVSVNCYEEGYSASCCDWWLDVREMQPAFWRKVYEKYIMNITYSPREFSEYYVMKPEDVVIDLPYRICKIPDIDKKDQEFIRKINEIFGYNESADKYDKKVIFFEESFFADGADVDDVGVVQKVSEIVGQENIMVKIHPRNPYNRWKALGYKTNENTMIPWEVIALNQDFSYKTLMSISCGSVISSYFLAGIQGKSFLLFDLFSLKIEDPWFDEVMKVCHQFMRDTFRVKHPNAIYIPISKKEFIEQLGKISNET